MKKIESWQKKKIYAIANALKYVNPQDKENDILHMLTWQIAGKESIKDLTYDEATKIITYLNQQQAQTATEGEGVTKGQQKKIWSLMYELKEQDIELDPTPVGERLAGIIIRQFGVRSSPKRLFTQLDKSDGNDLIEIMKHYIENAARRHMS